MNNYQIRTILPNGSYVFCLLGECTHAEAAIQLDKAIGDFAVSPKRFGRPFSMVLEEFEQ